MKTQRMQFVDTGAEEDVQRDIGIEYVRGVSE